MTLTGRIDAAPADLWHEEVLAPQFRYEAKHLLAHYVEIEKALLLEYRRMGLVDPAGAAAVAERLSAITADGVRASPRENMSDIFFAVERHASGGPQAPFAAWHVDRSRNDLQACAQRMALRDQVRAVAGDIQELGSAVLGRAATATDIPMPGYTHTQAAQIISPAFYLSALSGEVLATGRRLLRDYDDLDACPLGAGALAGQELDWDRDRLAALLGFARAEPHALLAVASRGAAMSVALTLSAFAVTLSRFVTDLMAWAGSAHTFLDLPDSLAGISAAMPQKRNFPVLERIRGRCSRVAGFGFDLAQGQRNTPYTNTVEVAKEAGSLLHEQAEAMRSVLRLTRAVIGGLRFRPEAMRAACEREHLGAFTLANRLCLDQGVPWRDAQVVAGRYVSALLAAGRPASVPDGPLLAACAAAEGHRVADPDRLLAVTVDVDAGLRAKRSAGSTHPDQVRAVLAGQEASFAGLGTAWDARAATAAAVPDRLHVLLSTVEPR